MKLKDSLTSPYQDKILDILRLGNCIVPQYKKGQLIGYRYKISIGYNDYRTVRSNSFRKLLSLRFIKREPGENIVIRYVLSELGLEWIKITLGET